MPVFVTCPHCGYQGDAEHEFERDISDQLFCPAGCEPFFMDWGESSPWDDEKTCRVCGCTEDDCSQCVEKTGFACHWVEADLCSACS